MVWFWRQKLEKIWPLKKVGGGIPLGEVHVDQAFPLAVLSSSQDGRRQSSSGKWQPYELRRQKLGFGASPERREPQRGSSKIYAQTSLGSSADSCMVHVQSEVQGAQGRAIAGRLKLWLPCVGRWSLEFNSSPVRVVWQIPKTFHGDHRGHTLGVRTTSQDWRLCPRNKGKTQIDPP